MKDHLTIGNEYEYYLTEEIFIRGVVVFNDGVSAILKVTYRYEEGYFEILHYDEVKRFFPSFQDADAERLTEYLCLDVKSGANYFQRDLDTNTIMVPDFGSDDYKLIPADPWTFIKERCRNLLKYNLGKQEDKKKKSAIKQGGLFSIDIDEAVWNQFIKEYEEKHHISPDELNYGLNRSVYWLNNRNCAILTAWRGNYNRIENNKRNQELQQALRGLGFGVIRVKGCYAEIGKQTDKEDSFLVVDLEDTDDFMMNIYNQAEHYEQDAFLYKPLDEEKAFLIGTNDKFGKDKVECIGVMRINNTEASNYSEVGSGRISFEKNIE